MLVVVSELKELSSVVKVWRTEEACKGGPNKQLLKQGETGSLSFPLVWKKGLVMTLILTQLIRAWC